MSAPNLEMLYPWRCLLSIEDVAEDQQAGLRAIHQQWLEFEEREFQRTGNPVYAWGAYRTARAARLPVPDWVLGYLDGAADMLAHLALEPPANVAPAVAEALGFVTKGQKGRGSSFSDVHDMSWIFPGFLVELDIRRGDKPYLAWERVAGVCKISQATARRAHKRYVAFMKSGLPESRGCGG